MDAPIRVAVVHHWLVGMRGGEKVLERILEIFPDADLVTHVLDPAAVSPPLRRARQTFVGRLPFARRAHRALLPLMPRALEEVDLRGAELVISSEAGPAKGVIAPPDAVHLCYVHSPMRYIWDQYPDHAATLRGPARLAFGLLAHRLRQWDTTSAVRVDAFVANSAHVARRVRRVWGREATVVHPPVALSRFAPAPVAPGPDAPWLFLSELTPYKRADLAIEAVRGTGARLVVAGDGPERRRLERRAPPEVAFLGRVPDDALPALMAGSRALLFPGEEDFGLVPVEMMASGRPVIALGRGGAAETVVDGETGVLFPDQSVAGLRAAMDRFAAELEPRLDPARIAAQARRFSPEAFRAGLLAAIAHAAPHLAHRLPRAAPSADEEGGA